MRKVRSMTGMPVICRRQKIGRLMQADLSHDLTHMEGIWVDCGLKGTRYIPVEHLSIIGEMAVMADSRGLRKRCTASSLLYRAVATDGSRIGAIVGAEVDEITFLVGALELTRGFWDDLILGRRQIKGYSVQGQEIIITDSTQNDRKEEGQ